MGIRCKNTACNKKLLDLDPPRSKRIGRDMMPMTAAEAKFLFVDSYGGFCVDCCIKNRSAETSELIKRNYQTN